MSLQAMTEQGGFGNSDTESKSESSSESNIFEKLEITRQAGLNHAPVKSRALSNSTSKVTATDKSLQPRESPRLAEDLQVLVSSQNQQPENLPAPGKDSTTIPYVETDTEMAALADQMSRAIGFSAPTAASVQVRKGFLFDLEVSGPEFWKKHDNVWSNRKRKLDERREQRHGFFAADIIKYGAVDMLNPRPSNLTNEIHPLYQRVAFHGCEDEVYEQFLPALRLASMWMTQPICSQFWVTLAHGTRQVDEIMSSRFQRLQHRIHRDVPITQRNAMSVIEYIKSISKDYRMSFTFQDNFKQHGATYFGGTNKICDYGWEAEGSSSDQLLRIYTKLSSDYYIAAKKLSQLTWPDRAQVLRFHFGLAVLLVHETCHAIELAHIRKRPDIVPDVSYDPIFDQWIGHEPYFYNSIRPELGLTWEMYMFGGRILPINDRVDCLHGLCVFDWPDKNAAFDPNSREVHTIPMTYIEKMFQMEKWEQDFDLSKKNIWHIPRNGAKSIFLTYFTTMNFDEEQRIKDDEAAEALMEATGKWEKPADKKRRTSLEGEVLVSSTSTPDVGKEPSEEVKTDKDKLWKAALEYLRAQPRKPDAALQDEEDWPEWVKQSLREVAPSSLAKAGIRIADNDEAHEEASSSKASNERNANRKIIRPKSVRLRSTGKSELPRSQTAAAKAVGLGSGKRR